MSSSSMQDKGGLKIDDRILRVVNNEIAPGTGIDPEHFWASFGKLVLKNTPE